MRKGMTTRPLRSIIISDGKLCFEKIGEIRRNAEKVGEDWRTRGGKRSEGERKDVTLHSENQGRFSGCFSFLGPTEHSLIDN
jgi:hypothetical protein